MDKFKKILNENIPNAEFLFISKRGSHAYGTNIETSDEDFFGVYIQPIEDIMGFNYIDQINDEKNDIMFLEIRKFLELLKNANPGMMEVLATPEDCVVYKHPVFDTILNQKEKFVTKQCSKTFAGYATQQIKKAKGQDKMQNWEMTRVNRKTPLDFCYIHFKEKSFPLTKYLADNNMDQLFCGLSKLPHSRDTYAMFYDIKADLLFSTKRNDAEQKINRFINKIIKFKLQGFKGIGFETSNDIRLSSIPINCPESYFIGYISYNKDGYVTHCDDYRSYQTWLKNRNEQRYIDVKGHNQKIDGKNMMHCRRLLEMAREIGSGKGINVRRENAEYLLSIRRGEVDLQTLIDNADADIQEIEQSFKNSTLPDSVSTELIDELLVSIRKKFLK